MLSHFFLPWPLPTWQPVFDLYIFPMRPMGRSISEKGQKGHRFRLWMFLSCKQMILENIYIRTEPFFPLFDLFDPHRSTRIALKHFSSPGYLPRKISQQQDFCSQSHVAKAACMALSAMPTYSIFAFHTITVNRRPLLVFATSIPQKPYAWSCRVSIRF